MAENTKFIKIGISDDAKVFVQETADQKHTSEAEIVRRALAAYRFLERISKEDGQVILKRSSGELERLVSF